MKILLLGATGQVGHALAWTLSSRHAFFAKAQRSPARKAAASAMPTRRLREMMPAMMIKLNELVVNDHVVIPLIARLGVAAVNNRLMVELSGWDNNTGDLANWYRET